MSKAILIHNGMPSDCASCPQYLKRICDEMMGVVTFPTNREEICPLHEAIGYIEPSGNIVYLEPRHCDDCRHCNWNAQDGEHFCANDASPYFARATTGTCKYWEAMK